MSTIVSHPIFHPTRILSVDSSDTLLSWIQQQLQQGHKTVLIDFCNVMFMDSIGLGTLVIAHKKVQQAEGRLILCSLRGQARMLFDMAGMEQLFDLFESPHDFEQSLTATLPGE